MNDPQKPQTVPFSLLDRIEKSLASRHPELAPLWRKLNSPHGRLGILIAIIAVIAATLYTGHTKAVERAMQLDIERVSDLQQITLAIQGFYDDETILPDTLKGLETRPNPNYVRDNYLYDSETNRIYEYKAEGSDSYQLCSTFRYSTAEIARAVPFVGSNQFWDHDSGHHCFQITVKKPLPKAGLLAQ